MTVTGEQIAKWAAYRTAVIATTSTVAFIPCLHSAVPLSQVPLSGNPIVTIAGQQQIRLAAATSDYSTRATPIAVPIGTPIVLVFASAAFLFVPTVLAAVQISPEEAVSNFVLDVSNAVHSLSSATANFVTAITRDLTSLPAARASFRAGLLSGGVQIVRAQLTLLSTSYAALGLSSKASKRANRQLLDAQTPGRRVRGPFKNLRQGQNPAHALGRHAVRPGFPRSPERGHFGLPA